MLCPACGSDVPRAELCAHCGQQLPQFPEEPAKEVGAAAIGGPTAMPATAPAADPAAEPVLQAAQPVIPPVAQAAYGQGDAPLPPDTLSQAAPYQAEAATGEAPAVAFALTIVGLVLSLLVVTWIPGLICCIVALVLNANYSRQGLENHRKTPTTVLGITGVVVALAITIAAAALGAISADIYEALERNGFDPAKVEINIEGGKLAVTEKPAGSTGETASSGPTGASPSDSSSAAAAPGTANPDSSSTASSGDAGGAGTSAAAPSASSSAPAAASTGYLDRFDNPTLLAVTELTGRDLQQRLENGRFSWYDGIDAWLASDGSLFSVTGAAGDLARADIDDLPAGGAGEPVMLVLAANGYETPQAALEGLAAGVSIDERYEGDDVVFATVHSPSDVAYLLIVTEASDKEQTLLMYTEEAIAQGLFESTIGIDAGNSIEEVWKAITVA